MAASPYVPAPGTGPSKLVLNTYPAWRKALIIILWFVALIFGAVFIDISDVFGFSNPVSWVFVAFPVLLLSMIVWGTVHIFRYAVLLEGTVLVQRSGFTSRGCDLTRSVVTLGAYPMTGLVPMAGGGVMPVQSNAVTPALTAMDGRQAVRLNLQPPLAPWKLLALTDAIVAGGQRQDPAAWQVAATLRQWAGTPAG